MNKYFHSALLALAVAAIFLAVPFTDTFMFDSKKLVLFVVGLFILGVTAFNLWKKRSIVITLSPLYGALALMTVAVLASTFLVSPYPYEALYGWGGVLLMTLVVASLGTELISDKDTDKLPMVLAVSGAALAVITVLQSFGFGPSHLYNMVFGTNIPDNALFNLAESPLVGLEVFLVAGVSFAALVKQKMSRLSQPLFMGVGVALVVGVAVSLWSIFLNSSTKLAGMLPWSVNFTVARGEIMSAPKAALIGLGPESFAHGYNLYKPASVNTTSMWNVEFGNGANVPLTFVVTLGLLGLVSWLVLVFFIVKQVLKHRQLVDSPLTWILAALVVSQVVFPPSIVTIILFGVVLAYWLAMQSSLFEKVKLHTLITRINPDQTTAASMSITHVLSIGVSALLMAFILAAVYGSGRAFASSYLLFRSTEAVAKQKSANEIYELQKQAIVLNPYIDSNRRRYALTNLAVAQALANKPNLSDDERQQVLTLIQQAIREGRAATVIQPENARNWEALGAIYQNLVGVATGADQWTVNSFSRAIEADPNNPVLWFQLGSTFYQNQQYAEASRVFAQAVQIKPDYINAEYNLANALKQNKQYGDAKQVYGHLLTQLSPDSAEYKLVKAEANVNDGLLQSQKPSQTGQQPTASSSASVVEGSLAPRDKTVTTSPTDLSNGAQQYLKNTPAQP